MSVRYRLQCSADAIDARARALAVEQSIEMPIEAVRDERVRAEIVGEVLDIVPSPQVDDRFDVVLALAVETTGDEPGQMLNVVFGNCSLQPDVELIDLDLPAATLAKLPGPRFGIAGWRAAVSAAADRPVTGRPLGCTALKPQGLDARALADLAFVLARAGIDVIKDDHGIADQSCAPFAQRVPLVQRAIERANREKHEAGGPLAGHRSIYAPTLSGGPRRLAAQLRVAGDEGVGALLCCPMIIGVPAFAELVRAEAGVPLLAHPALAGHLRIAPPLLLGRLFRLFGADATIFPNWGGRFPHARADCLAIADRARGPLGPHAPAMPVPAGGMRLERVDEIVGAYGPDTMLLIGGDLLRAGDALAERAAKFARRVAEARGTDDEPTAASRAGAAR
ncbi:MAG: RuBisCO large subunit C-terminal-like domain-containing protein [Burkholderiaceae bacterium]|nr:RuBisCO large subunit C-terminal-like domain-containing protein [Burkholderiaceae bacterium]